MKNEFTPKEIEYFNEDERKSYESCKSKIGKSGKISIKGLFGDEGIKAKFLGFDYMGAVPTLVFQDRNKRKAIHLGGVLKCE